MKKAFTITELLLAISLMVVLMAASGVVFKTAVKAHRTASATAEIARKLRGITDQLNADFKSLRKDGEIFVVNIPSPVDKSGKPLGAAATAAEIDHYERFDRIMFFADGNFQSYNEWPPGGPNEKVIHGDVARICYIPAKNRNGRKAQYQDREERILARSQHIFTADSQLVDIDPTDPLLRRIKWINPSPSLIGVTFTQANNNLYEYDNLTLNEWLNIGAADKADMLSILSDVTVSPSTINSGGLTVDTETKTPINVHQLLCEGGGEFSIQGWYEDPLDPTTPRWFPQLDLTPDDSVITDATDTDFIMHDSIPNRLHETRVIGYIYNPASSDINLVPWLGRALKFTFTLYDSRGVFKKGKKFTHIVYLDD